MEMKPLILISAEDIDFYLLLNHVLLAEGFNTLLASGPEEIMELAIERKPHTIVLDCRPHSFPAAETCTRLKEDDRTKDISVIALIGAQVGKQLLQLLNSGVDDAFTRPVSPAKLLGYLRTVHGESTAAKFASSGSLLKYADVELDQDTYRVRRNGHEIHLSPTEFRLLRHLLQYPGQVFSRDELISAAWQKNVHVGPRTVDVHMGLLRRALKLESDSDLIRTVRSAGYALADRLDGAGADGGALDV